MHTNTNAPRAFRSDGATRRLLGFGILLFGIYLGFGISGFEILRAIADFALACLAALAAGSFRTIQS